MKELGIYVSLFALGHSTTMLLGVCFHTPVLIAMLLTPLLGFRLYKALDNMGAFKRLLGFSTPKLLFWYLDFSMA